MNVVDIISLMRTQGIGENFNDAETQRRYLSFLNLAHDELYSKTASINPLVLITERLSNVQNQNYITTASRPSVVSLIIQENKTIPIDLISMPKFILYKARSRNYSDPKVAFNQSSRITFFPTSNGVVLNFDVLYAPERVPLTLQTLESQIPYPPEFQHILVDGALYYVFQDEGGFRSPEKESKAEQRWRDGIDRLMLYFTGTNQETINTFSEL